MKTIVVLGDKLDTTAHTILGDVLSYCLEDDIDLDARHVQLLGGRCLEMLFCAANSARQLNKNLKIIEYSSDFLGNLETFGLVPKDIDVLKRQVN